MGERELKEDVQKLQKLTGISNYDYCYKVFVKANHNLSLAKKIIEKDSNRVLGIFENLFKDE